MVLQTEWLPCILKIKFLMLNINYNQQIFKVETSYTMRQTVTSATPIDCLKNWIQALDLNTIFLKICYLFSLFKVSYHLLINVIQIEKYEVKLKL